MDRSSILIVVGLAATLFVIGLLTPPSTPPSHQLPPPWQIEILPGGGAQVMGVTLQRTPLKALEQRLGETAELALFKDKGRGDKIEAFFAQANAGFISGKLFVELAASPTLSQAVMAKAQPGSINSAHGRTLRPHPQHLQQLRELPIRSLSFMPKAKLQPQQIEQRFGKPDQRLTDPSSGDQHWLYPQLGLDVIQLRRKSLLQYVDPAEFERLRQPLLPSPSDTSIPLAG